jgi:anti-sigma factor RsiW
MIEASLIHAYTDGELDEAERSEVEQALAADPTLHAQIKAVEVQRDLLRSKLEPVDAPEVWKASRARLKEIDATRRTEYLVGRYAWSLCAVLFFAIVGIGGMHRNGAATRVFAADVPGMTANLVPFTVPKMSAQDEVRSWLGQVMGGVPPLSLRPELQVTGAAEGIVDGRKVLQLRLSDDFGNLALMVIPKVDSLGGMQTDDGKFHRGRVDNFPCVAWTHSGYGLILFGDRSPEELTEIAYQIGVD